MQNEDEGTDNKAKAEKLIRQAWDEEDLGRHATAVEKAMEALTLDADNWYINACLGLFLRKQGKLEEAEKYCAKTVELDPENSRAWESLGITHMYQERFSQAAEQFAKSVELDERPSTYTLMASAKISLGDLEGAIRDSERALELDPDWDEAADTLQEAKELLSER